MLEWQAIPALTYRLQYKTNLMDATWRDLVPDVSAASKFVRFTNTLDSGLRRFYRIMQVGS